MLAEPERIADINDITNAEQAEAETKTSDAVKAALLISGANKRRYGGLNNDPGNNYLMGTDQYPDTTEKAIVLLGNYKPPRQQQRHHPEMMEELPSSREDEGIMEDADADAGGDARGVRSGGPGRGNATTVSTISEDGSVARSNLNG